MARNLDADVTPRTRCPYCQCRYSIVIETEGIRRRRQCLDCGRRYNTLETVDGGDAMSEGAAP